MPDEPTAYADMSDERVAELLRARRNEVDVFKQELERRGYLVDARSVTVKISKKVTKEL